ncbi:M15 family metallopeptidase [Ornithinibacillus salinisoli]|uniref:M15 family metallopeptidase n=1 Tax=Ornithinibacillus salinisoli TaxID=1848459 RepID=A0ABW4W203_9BACI
MNLKIIKNLITTIVIVSLFLAFILFLYQFLGYDRYSFEGEDASMPTELHPLIAKKKEQLIKEAKNLEITVVITESIRTIERQDELYTLGRTKEGNIVTYAKGGESYHNYGLAIDFAIMKHKDELTWDINYDGNENGSSDWFEVADIAKELGFEWGGDWSKFKDYPHLQMTFDLSIKQLQRGIRPKEDLDHHDAR